MTKRTWSYRELLRQHKKAERGGTAPPEPEHFERPRTRKDCKNGIRPCPYMACRYHLALDTTESANPGITAPWGDEPAEAIFEMDDTCALDVADRGPTTLEDVGEILNLTRERVRQVEHVALQKLRDNGLEGMESAVAYLTSLRDK